MIARQWSDSAPDARRRLTVLVLVLCIPTFAISLLGATRLLCAIPGLTAGPSQQVQTNSARIKSRKDDSEMILIPAGTFIYGCPPQKQSTLRNAPFQPPRRNAGTQARVRASFIIVSYIRP